jgi:hypothetical protein
VLHYTEKRKKYIIFITGLHSEPQGCGASVASAAGPFNTLPPKKEQILFFVFLHPNFQQCSFLISGTQTFFQSLENC